jgi:hypothetical protein
MRSRIDKVGMTKLQYAVVNSLFRLVQCASKECAQSKLMFRNHFSDLTLTHAALPRPQCPLPGGGGGAV